jgi:hypothetical protein
VNIIRADHHFDRGIMRFNDRGNRIGESHQNAKISDADVEKIRTLHEEEHVGYYELARTFGISVWEIGRICRYERRNQWAARTKKEHQ